MGLVIKNEWAECWRSRAFYFDHPVIDLDLDDFRFESMGALLPELRPRDVIYRDAAGAVDSRMRRLDASAIAGDLEARLSGETTSLMIQNIHGYDPIYQAVLDRFVDWVASSLDLRCSEIRQPSASVFMTSPGGVSSYHTDREQNVLLHLRGKKTVHVFPRTTSGLEDVLSAFFRKRKGIHFEYRPEMEESALLWELEPQTALYMPRLWPHWVKNGDAPALSLSLNFFILPDLMIERLYRLSDRLRNAVARTHRAAAS